MCLQVTSGLTDKSLSMLIAMVCIASLPRASQRFHVTAVEQKAMVFKTTTACWLAACKPPFRRWCGNVSTVVMTTATSDFFYSGGPKIIATFCIFSASSSSSFFLIPIASSLDRRNLLKLISFYCGILKAVAMFFIYFQIFCFINSGDH